MEEEEEKTLTVTFTITEMNVILQALSKEPFKEVFQLIGKINQEATLQLDDESNNDS